MLNAYGNNVKLNLVNKKDVNDLIALIVAKLSSITRVQGIFFSGSMIRHPIDYYSDLDLRIFCNSMRVDDVRSEVYKMHQTLGAKEDDHKFIHSPFDDFGFQFGDICVETDICSMDEIKREIDTVLSGVVADEGLISLIQGSVIVYDRDKNVSKWKQEIDKLSVSKEMLKFCLKRCSAVSLKLLHHAIKRGDYPSVHHWLWRTFIDSARILFVKNKIFFPGLKRLLIYHIPRLEYVPKGYLDFWKEVFENGVISWDETYEKALKFMLEIKK